MSKIERLNLKVEKLLSKAVQEVLEAVKETVAEYQEKTARTQRENLSLKKRLQELQDQTKHNIESKSSAPLQATTEGMLTEVKEESCGNSHLNNPQNNSLFTSKLHDNPHCEQPFISMNEQFPSTIHIQNGNSNRPVSVLDIDTSITEKTATDPYFGFMSHEIKAESTSEGNAILTNHFQENLTNNFLENTCAGSLGRLTQVSSPSNKELKNEPDKSLISTPNNPAAFTNKYRNRVTTSKSPKLRLCVQRLYCCSFCSRTFKHAGDFKKHCRVHTGEKPYCCSVCGKRFTQKGCLTVHLRRHTGEKPFACRRCGRNFTDSGNMRKHEQICTKDLQMSYT